MSSRSVPASRVSAPLLTSIVVAIFALVVPTTLPIGRINRSADARLQGVLDLTGLEQGWGLFSPMPSSETSALEVVFHLEDGPSDTVSFPERRPIEPQRATRWFRLPNDAARGEQTAVLRRIAIEALKRRGSDGVEAVELVEVRRLRTSFGECCESEVRESLEVFDIGLLG